MRGNGVHCIYCGQTAQLSAGPSHAHCPACGGEFEYQAAEKPQPVVLGYATPEANSRPRLDGYCLAAFLTSLLSCLLPVFAAAGVVLAILGLRRLRAGGRRGREFAVGAIVLGLIGTFVFFGVWQGLAGARSAAIQVACMSNLRQIGTAITMYEAAYPKATGYALPELMAMPGQSAAALRCPAEEEQGMSKTVSSSYILLVHLEPFGRLKDQSTVIAFDRTPHHILPSDGHPEMWVVNVLFANGAAKSLGVDEAATEIEKSMRAEHRRPAPPATTQGTVPKTPDANSYQ